jgi:hypothetical protein
MNDLSRRSFLGTSSLAAAAVAGAIAVPTLMKGDDESPTVTGVVDDTRLGGAPVDDGDGNAVILHIDDAATGEISAYVGYRHVVFTDRALVARVQALKP